MLKTTIFSNFLLALVCLKYMFLNNNNKYLLPTIPLANYTVIITQLEDCPREKKCNIL